MSLKSEKHDHPPLNTASLCKMKYQINTIKGVEIAEDVTASKGLGKSLWFPLLSETVHKEVQNGAKAIAQNRKEGTASGTRRTPFAELHLAEEGRERWWG